MKKAILFIGLAGSAWPQEADSGLEVRTNVSTAVMVSSQLNDEPRSGSPIVAGMRALVYPTWKISRNWAVSGAVQIHTRPYFVEQFSTRGHGVRSDVLQLHLTYSRFWNNNSVVLRAGQLSSAFGSFLLRYDDTDNWLLSMPLAYGYYYKPVTTYGLTGTQADVTLGRVDLRVQLANSSPANRRSMFDSDQYGNWAAGVGYTVVQGLRFGISGYRGPYLHRSHRYFLSDEAPPRELPGSAFGIDAEWARGHWSARGEWQNFRLPYRAMPTYMQDSRYVEVRRVLHPRMFVAARTEYLKGGTAAAWRAHEIAAGYRPNQRQLIKVGYQVPQGNGPRIGTTFAVQLVTTLPSFSFSRTD